jgi:predicted RNA-binding protein associated with RNAse of E/G family
VAHIHPPKVELFDLDARTNTDPKGFVRDVEQYRVEPFGLYMARPVVGHPRIAYLQSWLLPDLGIRANDFTHHPDDPREWDRYLDIVDVTVAGSVWTTVDHYLDVGLRSGRGLDVLDTDELAAAILAELIDADTAHRAMLTAFRTVDGLAAHGYHLDRWLAGRGITVTWQQR